MIRRQRVWTGLYTMLDDNLAVRFHTLVLDADVTVAGIDLTDDEQTMPYARAADRVSAFRS